MDQLDLIESLWLRGDYGAGDELAEAFFGRSGRVVDFNPNQHPRDAYGKFAGVLGGLAPGDQARTPGGVTVTRTRRGYHVKAARARDLDRRSRHSDPREAAAAALSVDLTPREPTRIGGRQHKKGGRLSRRDVGALPKGSPVVTASGEYGRVVGVQRTPGRSSADRAVIEFDPKQPTRSSKPHRARVPLEGLSAAVPLARDAEGAHPAPHEESPGAIDAAVKGGLADAVKHIGLGGAGDALHALHDAEGALARKDDPLAQRVARAEATARRQRSADTAAIARSRGELARVERQLRHFGIVPRPHAGPPAWTHSPGRAR